MPEGLQPISLVLVCIALVTLVLILGQDSKVLQMLSTRVKDVSVLIFGILVLVGSLAADGLGRQQIMGALGGIAITVCGLHFLRLHRKTPDKKSRGGDGLYS